MCVCVGQRYFTSANQTLFTSFVGVVVVNVAVGCNGLFSSHDVIAFQIPNYSTNYLPLSLSLSLSSLSYFRSVDRSLALNYM